MTARQGKDTFRWVMPYLSGAADMGGRRCAERMSLRIFFLLRRQQCCLNLGLSLLASFHGPGSCLHACLAWRRRFPGKWTMKSQFVSVMLGFSLKYLAETPHSGYVCRRKTIWDASNIFSTVLLNFQPKFSSEASEYHAPWESKNTI